MPITTGFRQALFAHWTDKAVLPLIEINHISFASPIRLVRNTEDIVSNGYAYQKFGFDILLPGSSADEGDDKLQLSVDAVDQSIIRAVRELDPSTGGPTVKLSLIVHDAPNVVEDGPYTFTAELFSYDEKRAVLTLSVENRMMNTLTALTFNPADFPGVF